MSFLSFISGKDQQLNSSSSESFLQKNSNPLKKTVRSLRRAASQLSFKISSSKSGQKSTFVGASSDPSLSNTPIIPAETSLLDNLLASHNDIIRVRVRVRVSLY